MSSDRDTGGRAPTEGVAARGRRADHVRNQAAIVDAALRVLVDRPRASMDEIAEATGLGRATLYRHFRTRADLVHAIQRSALDAAGEAIAACGLENHDAPTALRCAVEALAGVGDRYRALGREISLDPSLLEQQESVARPLLETVRRGQEDGELRRDLPAPWVIASMGNLLVLALREIGAGRLDAAAAAEIVSATLLEGITAER